MEFYDIRMPTVQEWHELFQLTGGNDDLIHWKENYCWALDGKKHSPFAGRGVRMPCLGGSNADMVGSLDSTQACENVGFRPVFVPKTPDDTVPGTVLPIATLFVRTPALTPILAQNLPLQNRPDFEFREAMGNSRYQIKAIKVGDVYIADRTIVTGISWDELALLGYDGEKKPVEATLPTMEEYRKALKKNPDMHWENMYSWLDDEPGGRVGYISPLFAGEGYENTRSEKVGFRPMFRKRAVDPAADIVSNAATLFIDGNPVKVPQHPTLNGDIPEFKPGSKIEFRDAMPIEEYQIPAVPVGDYMIADRCVLRSISWNDLKALGF